MKRSPIVLSALTVLLMVAPLGAQTTRPGEGAARGDMLLQRVRSALADLKLSDEQKAKVDEVIQTARQDIQQMAGELQQMGQQERGERVREFMMSLRDKIGAQLNDEQKKI